MLTFDLPWPPFCRNVRFLATPKLPNFTPSWQKLENMKMLNSHFDDFKARYTFLVIILFWSCLSSDRLLLIVVLTISCSLFLLLLLRLRSKRRRKKKRKRGRKIKERKEERKKGKVGRKERKGNIGRCFCFALSLKHPSPKSGQKHWKTRSVFVIVVALVPFVMGQQQQQNNNTTT